MFTLIRVILLGIVLPLSVLGQDTSDMDEVVVTGTLKGIRRTESPIPVEVITPKLFKKNPTPSLFEAVGILNGVQPQLNCNICNTGDIHINGMEGPYTMILIDGMPIVSALSTVYGLSGIPNSIVERIEVVKGPAAALYGSEAMGGIINVITKDPVTAPKLSADVFGTSWGEMNADVSGRFMTGKVSSLVGVNYFKYANPIDKNGDGFTDLTLQDRISIFNKWSVQRKSGRAASLAGRYVYEDRWGGQMNYTDKFRGTDSIYGESIITKRAELIGLYQLPTAENITTQVSYNWHQQDSYYGTTPFFAKQQVAFVQTYWEKSLGAHELLIGGSYRHTIYDDNSPATASADGTKNQPSSTPLPGAFIQDEWRVHPRHKLLAGFRYDHDKNHGSVYSPRLAYKFVWTPLQTIRASVGTGFRVVNLFTEDHAALTGSREVVIREKLLPERSYNANLNYVHRIPATSYSLNIDATLFYSYFTNRINADFDSDPSQIIYDNLKGHAVSRGVSLNTDLVFKFPLKLLAGVSYMDVYQVEQTNGEQQRSQQVYAPRWSGNLIATYNFRNGISMDLTGKWNGPMRLPVVVNDPRPAYSPTFAILNLQISKSFNGGIELYGGVKNLLDFVPSNPILNPQQPFGDEFDTSYIYASLQGIRGFLGLRYQIK